MKQVTHFIINSHQEIIRYLLIIFAIGLIVYWLPEGGKFKYEFSKGKVWQYDDLYAPFDFAIEKGEEELKVEENNLLKDFKYIYKLDRQDETFQREFKKYFNQYYSELIENSRKYSLSAKKLSKEKPNFQDKISKIFIKEYRNGSFNIKEIERLKKEGIQFVYCESGKNHIKKIKTKRLTTVDHQLSNLLALSKSFSNPDIYHFLISSIFKELEWASFIEDKETNQSERNNLISSISKVKIGIKRNEEIIRKGNLIDANKFEMLTAMKDLYEKGSRGSRNNQLTAFGFFLLILLTMGILMVYLKFYQPKVFNSNRNIIYILSIIVGFIYLIGLVNKIQTDSWKEISIYIIPICMIPILIRAFFDSGTAIFTSVTVILITGYIVPNSFEFVVLSFITCFFSIFSTRKLHYISQFYQTSVVVLVTYFAGYFGTVLIQNGNLEEIDYVMFAWLALNALLTLVAFPLISVFEKIFGLVSEITIFELSDLNKPLLKELSIKAPGTFQHSLQVANLAEAAADEIDANPLLTRVGALYHDIGKMHMPTYYIENQITGINPHDDLNFEDSARIIIDHVIQGIEMAKKAKLPDIIIDFIRTHHGDTRVEYFYQSFLKNYPDQEVDEAKFRYPGPIPYSKETACLMMADSVEAASRSLKSPTEEDINNLVNGIIDFKVKNNQLVNCDITFKDITKIKALFKKMLTSIYHVRISYPDARN